MRPVTDAFTGLWIGLALIGHKARDISFDDSNGHATRRE
jgi:hypothetical protein